MNKLKLAVAALSLCLAGSAFAGGYRGGYGNGGGYMGGGMGGQTTNTTKSTKSSSTKAPKAKASKSRARAGVSAPDRSLELHMSLEEELQLERLIGKN